MPGIGGVEAVIATGEIITVAWGGMGLRITGAAVAINATDRDLVNDMVKGMPMLTMQEEEAIKMERQLRKRRDVVETDVEIAIIRGMGMGETTTTITTAITTTTTTVVGTTMKIPTSDNTC